MGGTRVWAGLYHKGANAKVKVQNLGAFRYTRQGNGDA